MRPTEYPEKDIFVCESKYVESETENVIRKLSKGIKVAVSSFSMVS